MELSNETLNNGLNLSMEFGENWLIKINDRLSKKHPELTVSELNTCDKLCKRVNKLANDYVRKNPDKTENKVKFCDFAIFKKIMTTKYNWINDDNLNHLYSQSCYYALK